MIMTISIQSLNIYVNDLLVHLFIYTVLQYNIPLFEILSMSFKGSLRRPIGPQYYYSQIDHLNSRAK